MKPTHERMKKNNPNKRNVLQWTIYTKPIVVKTRKDLHMYRHKQPQTTTSTQTLYINAQHLYKVI